MKIAHWMKAGYSFRKKHVRASSLIFEMYASCSTSIWRNLKSPIQHKASTVPGRGHISQGSLQVAYEVVWDIFCKWSALLSSNVFAMSASLRHNQLERVKRGKNEQVFVSVNSCLSSFACSDILLSSISKEVVCFVNLFTPRNVRSPFKDEIHCFLLYSTAWEWPNASLPSDS